MLNLPQKPVQLARLKLDIQVMIFPDAHDLFCGNPVSPRCRRKKFCTETLLGS